MLRLLGSAVVAYVRSPGSFSFSNVLRNWVRSTTTRLGSENFTINLVVTRLFLVTSRDLSHHIMSFPPSSETYMEGPNKVTAMSFLAPQALTICHGEQWQRLRSYNESVLDIGDEGREQAIIQKVGQEFSSPISSSSDIRNKMSAVMLGVVFGNASVPPHLAEDIQVLFGYVTSPVRRILLGWREGGRRDRFYQALGQFWDQGNNLEETCLLGAAHRMLEGSDHSREELLQQIPHWMFTFTGSGTDLLCRSFAMVSSRPAVLENAQREITAAGPLDRPASINSLQYLEACILETCRLYPPVTRALHLAPQGDVFNESRVPSGVEILHYFPINHRDTSVDPTANDFLPQRWLDRDAIAQETYPNLFLSGPRTCPGKDLIMVVVKAALATMLSNDPPPLESPLLARDPLPFSFPSSDVQIRRD